LDKEKRKSFSDMGSSLFKVQTRKVEEKKYDSMLKKFPSLNIIELVCGAWLNLITKASQKKNGERW